MWNPSWPPPRETFNELKQMLFQDEKKPLGKLQNLVLEFPYTVVFPPSFHCTDFGTALAMDSKKLPLSLKRTQGREKGESIELLCCYSVRQ